MCEPVLIGLRSPAVGPEGPPATAPPHRSRVCRAPVRAQRPRGGSLVAMRPAIASAALTLSLLPAAGCHGSAPTGKPAPTESTAPAEDAEPAAPLTPRERDRRGDEHLLAGRFDEAMADFDAFLAAEPGHAAHHWRRGIACYYAARYDEGAAQFELHRSVNSDDVENAVWHFLCVARVRGVDEARAALLPVGPDPRAPMTTVYELFAGRATSEDVLAAADDAGTPDALFFGQLYVGLHHEALGETAAARRHLGLAATTFARPHYMGAIARMHAALPSD